MSERDHLQDVRGQLRRMGYLDHGVERFLLQDALRPARPWRTVLWLSAKVGLLGGALAALVGALLLAAINGLTRATPFDVVPLFLHLIPPFGLVVGVSFLLLAGVMALILFLSHTRRIETVSFAVAVVTALGTLLVLGWRGRSVIAELESWQRMGLAVIALVMALGVVRVVQSGLLSLAIRLIDHAPERRASRWLWRGLVITAVVTIAATLPAVFGFARATPVAPGSLALRPGARAVVIGVDGVLAEELAFVRAAGDLPALDARLADGATWLRYVRPPVPPASLWTTVSTGLPDPDHGMVALDSFQPLGLRGALTRSGWLRPYWARFAVPLGLARYRPVLAHERRAPTFWELAGRGAVPKLAVNWWGTYPAQADAGLVVAHGGYRLLGEGVDGAASPAEAAAPLRRALADLPTPAIESALASVLDPDSLTTVREEVLAPDLFYRQTFQDHWTSAVGAAALYLPTLDVLAGLVDLGSVAFGEVVRWHLKEVDALLETLAGDVDIVLVVFDPGRRRDDGSGEGRALLWLRDPCTPSAMGAPGGSMVEPGALTAAVLRVLGLPQSRELPAPPPICAWAPPTLWVDTYGVRHGEPATRDDAEYLDNLKSLGYL